MPLIGEVTKIDSDGDVWFAVEGDSNYVGTDEFKEVAGVEPTIGLKVECGEPQGCWSGIYLKGLAK